MAVGALYERPAVTDRAYNRTAESADVLNARIRFFVVNAAPTPPWRSTTIKPPQPLVRRLRMPTAASAASCAELPAATRSLAVFARTTFMIDSPLPVDETAAPALSA